MHPLLSRCLDWSPNAGGYRSFPGALTVTNNMLNGPLPRTIGKFVGLTEILLNGNEFTGPIPTEINELRQLSKLDFSNNRFSGQIPDGISQWKLLSYIYLSRDNLSGPIPSTITSLGILNYLNISRNHFSGSIPNELEQMQSLTFVDFSYNNLSTIVPNGGQFTFFNATSFVGNPGLCGLYLGPCTVQRNSLHAHVKGSLISSTAKLVLVIGLLLCSLVFASAAIIKARALKKSNASIAGSSGYIALENAYTLKVDEKSDVYSFGVVLLELVTGRRPVGEFGDGVDIVQWVNKMT